MKKDKQKDKTQKKNKKPTSLKPEEKKNKKIKKNNKRSKTPFVQIDRGGNIFTNFFSNFLRQLKNPTSTGLGKLLDKLLVIKIKESEKKPKEKSQKPVDIMGPVKTIFRNIDNIGNNNLTPMEKESLRQRTNQSVDLKREHSNEEVINKPGKPRLGM